MTDRRRTESVRYEVERGIGLLTLDRPEHRNAWTVAMAIELDEILADANRDDDVRVVVVTGADSVFSVGADLHSGSIDRPGVEQAEPPEAPMLPSQVVKPVIAALNGHAVGAGISFAMHCDFRILAETAKIGFAFVRRGVIAEMAMHWLLPRVVGMAVAADLLLTGRTVDADEARRLGLVHRVLPSRTSCPPPWNWPGHRAARRADVGGDHQTIAVASNRAIVSTLPGRASASCSLDAPRTPTRSKGSARSSRSAARMDGPARRRSPVTSPPSPPPEGGSHAADRSSRHDRRPRVKGGRAHRRAARDAGGGVRRARL